VFSIFKRKRFKSLAARDAEDIAKNLYSEFVLERCGKGFDDEMNSLRPEVRHAFAAKIDRYREAMLLAAVGTEAESWEDWGTVLHSCEERVFGLTPQSRLQKISAIMSAMADLGQLLNPNVKRELPWGVGWFRDIGDDAIARNPVRLSLFVSAWMDEYVALLKTIRQVSDGLRLK
jgi:hypothetical protein